MTTTTTMTTSRIIFQNESGGVSVIVPTGSVELALKDVPPGVPYEIVDAADIPSDRTFRGAWVANGAAIEIDLDAAKFIGHDRRRAARTEAFAPFDEIIAKQIPGADAAEAEANRQTIREKYALIQDAIDAASDSDSIKLALEANQNGG
jgi:hypothetical protein